MQLCMEAAREAFFLGWEAGAPPLLTAACSTLLIGRSGNAEVDFFCRGGGGQDQYYFKLQRHNHHTTTTTTTAIYLLDAERAGSAHSGRIRNFETCRRPPPPFSS